MTTKIHKHQMFDISVENTKTHGVLTNNTNIKGEDGNIHIFTINNNIEITLTADCSSNDCRLFTFIITNNGSYTITWSESVKWDEGLPPNLTSNGIDIISLLTVDAGNTWYGFINGTNYS